MIMCLCASAWLISDIWVFDYSPEGRGDLIRVKGPIKQLGVQ